jgi:hypothetical protein
MHIKVNQTKGADDATDSTITEEISKAAHLNKKKEKK